MKRTIVMAAFLGALSAGISSSCTSTKAAIGVQYRDAQEPIFDGTSGKEVSVVVDSSAAGGTVAVDGPVDGPEGGAGGTLGTTAAGGATGMPATGGMASVGGAVSTGGAENTGGAVHTGGVVNTGGTASTGGVTGSGGTMATGGSAIATGGTLATGGTSGNGGSTGTPDATAPGDGPPTDAYVDPTRYPSDKYLAWQAPTSTTNRGPALIVTQGASGAGSVVTWDSVDLFPPERPVSGYAGTYSVTADVLNDLFARLASVNFSSLPHPASAVDCAPRLYFRQCQSCTVTLLNYYRASQLVPEIESVWAWFDSVLGADAVTNPRNYCRL